MSEKVLVVVERFWPEDFLVNDFVAEWQKRGDEVEVLTQIPSYPFDRIFDGYKNRAMEERVESSRLQVSGGKFQVSGSRLGWTAKPDDLDGIAATYRCAAGEVRSGKGAEYGRNAVALSERMFDRTHCINRLIGGW